MGKVCNMHGRGERGEFYAVLVENPEERRTLARPRYTLKDDIKINFKVIGWNGVDLIRLDQNMDFVNLVINFRVS
jgi:hypothetical protein